MWKFLLEEATKLSVFVCPWLLVFDFELAAINAVRDSEVFGQYCYVLCCRFHFTNTLQKAINSDPVLRAVYARKPAENERGK